jgi:hypothetical protein
MRKSSRSGDIQEMASLLEMRKKNHQHTVLLLGARAGQLYRSTDFYDNLLRYSKRNFHLLPRIRQFQECYSILTSNNKFSERDLHSILQMSLKNLPATHADISLASLIRNQYFDEIISTNIDDVLEDALVQTEMKAGHDYQVMSIGRNPLQQEKSCFCRITKVFGDFVSQDYTVRERSSHLENTELKDFLQRLLGKDLLIVGFDPAWDQDILRIIPVNTKATMWFVSEDNDIMGKTSFLSSILHARHATCILGRDGIYDYFVRKLHEYLCGNVSPKYLSAHPQTIQNIQRQVARMVDILEQYIHLMALLPDINDRLESLQNNDDAFLGFLQEIYKKLEEIEKHQHDR